MLNKHGFDIWANGYENSVVESYNNDSYPFAGYKEIINSIYNEIMKKPKSNVLDIGIGTGILAKKLYDNAHKITGVDFSQKMLSISAAKMKDALLIQYDFTIGLPNKIKNRKFDFIVFTYSIHHLNDNKKTELLNSLKSYLAPGGKILIGDISFKKADDLSACKIKYAAEWDNDECYYSYEDTKNHLEFPQKSYQQISFCGGIMTLS